MKPVEECWRQLKQRLGIRFFGSVETLRPAIQRVLDDPNPPDILGYLFPSVKVPLVEDIEQPVESDFVPVIHGGAGA